MQRYSPVHNAVTSCSSWSRAYRWPWLALEAGAAVPGVPTVGATHRTHHPGTAAPPTERRAAW